MQGPKDFLGKKIWNAAFSAEMAKAPETEFNKAVAARLRVLRYFVAGYSQTAFAAQIGVDVKRWNNFERGLPLSKDVSFLLCQKVPGLTLDWLFFGKEDGLPSRLQRELVAAEIEVTSATGPR